MARRRCRSAALRAVPVLLCCLRGDVVAVVVCSACLRDARTLLQMSMKKSTTRRVTGQTPEEKKAKLTAWDKKLDSTALHAEILAMRQLPDKERSRAEGAFIAKYGPAITQARLYWWRGSDCEAADQDAVALEALLRALRTWQPSQGRGFKAWAAWSIRFALEGELRRARLVRGRRDGYVSMDKRQPADVSAHLASQAAAMTVVAQHDAEKQQRLAALDRLTPIERRCLAVCFAVKGVDDDVDISALSARERDVIARQALKRLREVV